MMLEDLEVNWTPGITLEEMEKQVILKAFRYYRGNKTQTAQALGIAIRTFDNKMEKYENDGKLAREQQAERDKHNAIILNRLRGLPPDTPIETKTPEQGVSGPPPGVRMESTPRTTAQYGVPVQKREEVQEVLPGEASKGSERKRSRAV